MTPNEVILIKPHSKYTSPPVVNNICNTTVNKITHNRGFTPFQKNFIGILEANKATNVKIAKIKYVNQLFARNIIMMNTNVEINFVRGSN